MCARVYRCVLGWGDQFFVTICLASSVLHCIWEQRPLPIFHTPAGCAAYPAVFRLPLPLSCMYHAKFTLPSQKKASLSYAYSWGTQAQGMRTRETHTHQELRNATCNPCNMCNMCAPRTPGRKTCPATMRRRPAQSTRAHTWARMSLVSKMRQYQDRIRAPITLVQGCPILCMSLVAISVLLNGRAYAPCGMLPVACSLWHAPCGMLPAAGISIASHNMDAWLSFAWRLSFPLAASALTGMCMVPLGLTGIFSCLHGCPRWTPAFPRRTSAFPRWTSAFPRRTCLSKADLPFQGGPLPFQGGPLPFQTCMWVFIQTARKVFHNGARCVPACVLPAARPVRAAGPMHPTLPAAPFDGELDGANRQATVWTASPNRLGRQAALPALCSASFC